MVGGWELIVILFIVLLLFGGKRLPDLARNLGKGIREFKKASQNITDEINIPTPSSPSSTPASKEKPTVTTEVKADSQKELPSKETSKL